MTKIVFCINGMSLGGAERVIANLSNYFSKDYDVTILTLNGDVSEYNLEKKVKLKSLNFVGSKNIFAKIISIIKNIKKYVHFLESAKPDIVISFLPRASYYSALACKIKKTKLIISERNDPHTNYPGFIKRKLTSCLYSLADGMVFQTTDAKLFFGKSITSKSTIIPNPVNDKFYKYKALGNDNKKIVSVGRLTKQKNHKLLIDAFKEFSKDYSDYKLYIYGDGVLKDYLEDYIDKLDLTKSVYLPGKSSNIIEDILDAKLFILSSDYEGMPNALMEALTLGIPCISTDCPCGGPKDLIQNNVDGLLIKVGDKDALINSMKELIVDKQKCNLFSKNSRIKMKQYKCDIINKSWELFIGEIQNGNVRKNKN